MDTHGTTMEELRTMEAIQRLPGKLDDLDTRMTLLPKRRDFFAGMALCGLLASGQGFNSDIATQCYNIADEMIKNKDKPE